MHAIFEEMEKTKEFMPYLCKDLDENLQNYAATYLNETEETRMKALQETRSYITREFGLAKQVMEDIWLLCLLRSRKFDVRKTCVLISKTAELAKAYPHLLDREDFEAVQQTIESKIVGFLPFRDSKRRAIVFVKCENWNPDVLKIEDLIYGAIASLQVGMKNPVNQVAGIIVIIDCRNVSLHQVLICNRWIMLFLQAIQNCCPFLVKEFHFVHTPLLIRTVWKLIKHFLSEKLQNRVTMYKSSNWERLHRRIPPEILPEELGGHLGPFSNDHWISDITKNYNKLMELRRHFFNKK